MRINNLIIPFDSQIYFIKGVNFKLDGCENKKCKNNTIKDKKESRPCLILKVLNGTVYYLTITSSCFFKENNISLKKRTCDLKKDCTICTTYLYSKPLKEFINNCVEYKGTLDEDIFNKVILEVNEKNGTDFFNPEYGEIAEHLYLKNDFGYVQNPEDGCWYSKANKTA